MIRLYIICEGQTEEGFVNNLLFHHFISRNIQPIPIVIGERGHKGGNVSFPRLRRNVRNSLRQENACYCTTLFDYYGLPPDFPGKSESKTKRVLSDIAEAFSASFENSLKAEIGENSMRRFIPYVQMHEFEALLFSDPERMASGFIKPYLHADFERIRNQFPTPEHINDSPNTAPSKRIIRFFPGYELQKPLYGTLAALEIGLPKIRQECPLFDDWLTQLENLQPLSA